MKKIQDDLATLIDEQRAIIKKIAYEVAKEIHYELEKRAINQTAGAV